MGQTRPLAGSRDRSARLKVGFSPLFALEGAFLHIGRSRSVIVPVFPSPIRRFGKAQSGTDFGNADPAGLRQRDGRSLLPVGGSFAGNRRAALWTDCLPTDHAIRHKIRRSHGSLIVFRDALSFLIALGGVAFIVGMALRLQTFSKIGREAILAAALSMFVLSKYIALATTAPDYIFAVGAAAYMAYFGYKQFQAFPRQTI